MYVGDVFTIEQQYWRGYTLTEQDRKKWNSKYLKNIGNSDPSEILVKYVSLAPKGKALDIACGNGRNSRFLAQKGFQVDAVDISNIAMSHLADKDTRINVICQDIDSWQIPQNRYQIIINIRFMDRRLFPMIQKGLKSGGVLIFESFIDEKKEYCVKQNEFLHAFESFHVVYYEERETKHSDKFDQSMYFVAIKNE
ncbi:Tellurite resistance protein TehB [Desulfobacula phenolica]|uniref:Tellurite resistance protein TehB n=1 Tax=Desulfobacula phenolica TaxID=90732 RepID=A0A1H2IMV2_9BACT|nr:Tellurite resistance protein TehB [Desulfobacula phenolica]